MKRFFLFSLSLLLNLSLFAQGELIPESLKSATWLTHMEKDLVPFWITADALGTPVGNYPTVRDMKGRVTLDTKRLPRMMGRQIFTYSIYYMTTGRSEMLEYARAGVRWLIDHAWDKTYGGWYAELDKDGNPDTGGVKYAQDSAYAAMGLAAYYFVTRDKEAEEYLLKTEALMFNPAAYWDETNQRIRDGLSEDLTEEVDQEGGGWELVALLDQLNAYMVLVQPVLTKPEDRQRWADHMVLLAQSIKKTFWQAPLFWGQEEKVGRGGRHVDFGHHFKTLWMLGLTDAQTGRSEFTDFVKTTIREQLPLAQDKTTGLWGYGTRNFQRIGWGSSWWIYAECDQVGAWMNIQEGGFTPLLARSAEGWLKYFVDKTNGEVYPDIRADGSVNSYPETATAKVWDWKNGFHAAEHALIMYIHGKVLEKQPVPLYFAQPSGTKEFAARSYLLPLKEQGRTSGETFRLGSQEYRKVLVNFQ